MIAGNEFHSTFHDSATANADIVSLLFIVVLQTINRRSFTIITEKTPTRSLLPDCETDGLSVYGELPRILKMLKTRKFCDMEMTKSAPSLR